MEKEKYRFIHLSDIHFGQERNGTILIHEDARAKLIEDCAAFSNEKGPADGILIVGDIAFSGQDDEYKTAAAWLRKVARAGGCEEFAVRTVPGNHDIDRNKISLYGRNAHKDIRRANPQQLDGILEEHLAVTEENNALLPKVSDYREFASRFDCDFPSLRKPCWTKDYPLGQQYCLRILGMNSVQVCDAEDTEGNMILGNNQYVISEESNTVPVAMIHHPLNWFSDRVRAKPYLHRAPILLFGHEHAQGCERVEDELGRVQVHVYSGAANPPEGSPEYPFRYNWLEFELIGEPNSRSIRLSLWPRIWSFREAKYVPDRQALGDNQFHSFDVPCPKFEPERDACDSDAGSNSPGPAREVTMHETDRDFERLKYFFWTYLDWQDRVKVLAGLDLLPNTPSQPMPQTLEHLALKVGQQRGRLHDVWERTMAFVPPNVQAANPFED